MPIDEHAEARRLDERARRLFFKIYRELRDYLGAIDPGAPEHLLDFGRDPANPGVDFIGKFEQLLSAADSRMGPRGQHAAFSAAYLLIVRVPIHSREELEACPWNSAGGRLLLDLYRVGRAHGAGISGRKPQNRAGTPIAGRRSP